MIMKENQGKGYDDVNLNPASPTFSCAVLYPLSHIFYLSNVQFELYVPHFEHYFNQYAW